MAKEVSGDHEFSVNLNEIDEAEMKELADLIQFFDEKYKSGELSGGQLRVYMEEPPK